MTKHIKHIAIVLLLVIMGSIFLACNPNGTKQKPLSTDGKDNDNNAIYFENQVVYSKIVDNEFEGNYLIHSYSDLEEFFTDHFVSDDNQAIFNQYNTDYFNDKALVLCYFWATDARIKRQLENVYIDGNTLQIEVMNILPYPLTSMNLDCFFIFNILQVKKSDITNITDVAVSHKYSNASDNNTANVYKQAKKQEIQAYATSKLNDSYSEENRTIINGTVETCNQSIDNAKNTEEIDLIVMNTKQNIDGVEPLQSNDLKDGAYFITDTSFELYYANRHPLQGDADKQYIWALIVGNQIIINNSHTTVYTITDNNGIYRGASFVSYNNVDIWLLNDILYIRDTNKTLSYKVDSAYDTSAVSQTTKLAAPSEISITDGELEQVSLSWAYSHDYGYFGCGVEIQNSECTDFMPIQIQYPWINTMVVDSLQNYLKQGENIIRIHNIGGYSIANDKTVYVSLNSDYVTFRVFVHDGIATVEQV